MWMPILLVCSSVYAESCIVVTRNWEFHKHFEICLGVAKMQAEKLFEHPQIYHIKPLCQEIILSKPT